MKALEISSIAGSCNDEIVANSSSHCENYETANTAKRKDNRQQWHTVVQSWLWGRPHIIAHMPRKWIPTVFKQSHFHVLFIPLQPSPLTFRPLFQEERRFTSSLMCSLGFRSEDRVAHSMRVERRCSDEALCSHIRWFPPHEWLPSIKPALDLRVSNAEYGIRGSC